MIDIIVDAEVSAIIIKTEKANNLKQYDYFEQLLTEIFKHMDGHDTNFCEYLILKSDKLPQKY